MSNRLEGNGKNRYRWLVPFLVTVVICSVISWFMTLNLAVPKSAYAEIAGLNNTMGHLNDSITGLDRLVTYQTNGTLDRFDDIDDELLDISSALIESDNRANQIQNELTGVKTQTDGLTQTVTGLNTTVNGLNTTVTGMNTSLGGLNTTVNGLKTDVDALEAKTTGAIQITPTVTTTTTGGTISLSVKTDVAQTLAFRVEFRPTTETQRTETTFEAALKALYEASPQAMALTAGSTSIRGDYNLYWKGGTTNKYCLSSVVFTTPRTSLTAGTQTKTLTYTAAATYEILITPVYPTGTSTGSW